MKRKFYVVAVFMLLTIASCAVQPSHRLGEINLDELTLDKITEPKLPVISTDSCFSGPYQEYETWMAHLQEFKSTFNISKLQKRVSKDRFEWAKEQFDCQRIRYSVGELTVEGFTIRKLSVQNRLPVVIYNRGGNASHARIEFRTLFQRLFDLADNGFFVIASQYRGSGISGPDVNPGKDEFGGADVADVMALFDIIDNSPEADPERIGMLGWSRGAIMSFIALTKTNRVSALVVGGPPVDIIEELKLRPKMERVFKARIPNYKENGREELKRRSVLYWPERLPKAVPILILHGRADNKVSVVNSLKLALALQEQGIRYRLVVYDKGNHSLLPFRSATNNEIARWFTKELK